MRVLDLNIVPFCVMHDKIVQKNRVRGKFSFIPIDYKYSLPRPNNSSCTNCYNYRLGELTQTPVNQNKAQNIKSQRLGKQRSCVTFVSR